MAGVAPSGMDVACVGAGQGLLDVGCSQVETEEGTVLCTEPGEPRGVKSCCSPGNRCDGVDKSSTEALPDQYFEMNSYWSNDTTSWKLHSTDISSSLASSFHALLSLTSPFV